MPKEIQVTVTLYQFDELDNYGQLNAIKNVRTANYSNASRDSSKDEVIAICRSLKSHFTRFGQIFIKELL